jgi:hypothetical protein
MKCHNKLPAVGGRAGLTVALALTIAILASPARAADPIFPFGSRVGLVPPAGMVASESFAGFSDPSENAAILITVLPAAAYEHVEKSFDADALKKQGIILEKREPMQLRTGKGFLVISRQLVDKQHYRKWLLVAAADDLTVLVSVQIPEHDKAYPDDAVRTALATLSVRSSVPQEEELRLLPFKIGDLAGFHIEGVLPGRAIVLGDAPPEGAKEGDKGGAKEGSNEAPKDASKEATGAPDARMLIAAVPGGPSEFDDRANFARLMFNEIGGVSDVHLTLSEPLRIGGQPGYQTMAQAKDARSGADVMVVQWLRFGASGFLQMTAIARAENWTSVLSRLRTVRDSITVK